jgi:glycosyltransferase involved in cell wall biosynthesis
MNVSCESRALIRVFVPTRRRHALLMRAIESLLAQTFVDWTCEVHNDDPADTFPRELVRQLADPRIVLRNHDRNLGPVGTFNSFYLPTREPFYSILEDDNWWEPEFLATMLRELQTYPAVTLAWCNQQIWEECQDGSWQNTGDFANPLEQSGPRLIEFGTAKQAMGALHANGAMIMRSRANETYITLPDIPFVAMEAFRDRMIPHPFLYVPQPMAAFSRTLQTSRSESRDEWAIVQTMLLATFIKHAQFEHARLKDMFSEARVRQPPYSGTLICAALLEPSCRSMLRYSKAIDWFLLLRGVLRRPTVIWRVLHSRQRQAAWWRELEFHTAERFKEKR